MAPSDGAASAARSIASEASFESDDEVEDSAYSRPCASALASASGSSAPRPLFDTLLTRSALPQKDADSKITPSSDPQSNGACTVYGNFHSTPSDAAALPTPPPALLLARRPLLPPLLPLPLPPPPSPAASRIATL